MTTIGPSKPFDSIKSYKFENIKVIKTEVETINSPSGNNLNLTTSSGGIILLNSNVKISDSGDLTIIGNIYIQDIDNSNYIKRLYNDENNLIWGSDTIITDATLGSELQSITDISFNNISINGHLNGANNSSGLKIGGKINLNGIPYTFPSNDGTNGYVLTTNGDGLLNWTNVNAVPSLNTISDISLSNITNNHILTYNSENQIWINTNSPIFSSLIINETLEVSGNTNLEGTITLNGLEYTFPNSESADYYLKTNGSGVLTWAEATAISTINDLTDISITNVTTNQILTYNGSQWVNNNSLTLGNSNIWGNLEVSNNINLGGTITLNGLEYTFPNSETADYYLKTNGSGILTWASIVDSGSTTINDLTDTTITNATTNQILIYNGSQWVNDNSLTLGNSNVWGNLEITGNTLCKGNFTTSGTVIINTISPLIINNYYIYTFTETTTNNTPTTTITFPTSNNIKYMVECAVSAVENTNAMGFKVTSFFHNNSGTLNQIGTTDILAFGGQSWIVSTSVSTTNILIQITGENLTNIDWKGDVKFILL